MLQTAKRAAWWMWVQAWPFSEIASADDEKFREALAAQSNDCELLEALRALTSSEIGDHPTGDQVFSLVDAVVIETGGRQTKRLADEKPVDAWVHLFNRMHGDQQVLKAIIACEGDEAKVEKILAVEEQLVPRLAAHDAQSLYDIQDRVARLLYAFNRDAETAKHRELANKNTRAGEYIASSIDFYEQQRQRMIQGVRVHPWRKGGVSMRWIEIACLIAAALGIVMINGFTEFFTFSFKEFVGVARNGVGRPRSFWQLVIAMFFYQCVDAWYMWEIGRQRSLGASLSFWLYMYAYFHPEVYGRADFVIGTAIGAIFFQLLVQLYDLVWIAWKLFWITREAYHSVSFRRFLGLWTRTKLPERLGFWKQSFETGWYKPYPSIATTAGDQVTYQQLKTFNERGAAFVKQYAKSRQVSVSWMLIARAQAMPRNIYAARGGVIVKLTLDGAFWQKMGFVVGTMGVWAFSAWAVGYRKKWQTFTIITAFYAATTVKLLELATSPEQEVGSALTTFCNMVASAIPTLIFALVLSAARPEWFEKPRILIWNMPLNFILGFWTDLLAEGLKNTPGRIRGWWKKRAERKRAERFGDEIAL
jgi:hypothetical protein